MTRKKYDRDLEGEAIREVYGKEESESDEEKEEEEEFDPWDELQTYMYEEIKHTNADWISKWFDASDMLNIIGNEAIIDDDAVYWIRDYLFPFETVEDVNSLLDHIWNMHEICRIEPDITMLYSALLELLAERTKYYYVNPTVAHRRIVNRKFFQLGRRPSAPCTNSQK